MANTNRFNPDISPDVGKALGVVAAILVLFALTRGGCEQDKSKREPTPVESTPKWYEGGTLHRATMREWRSATYANKLATAADFVSVNLREIEKSSPEGVDIERDVRPAAVKLVIQLDSISPNSFADAQTVGSVVATLTILQKRLQESQ